MAPLLTMTNWPRIHLLQARLRFWKAKRSYRRRELDRWKITGDHAHYWQAKHLVEVNDPKVPVAKKAVAKKAAADQQHKIDKEIRPRVKQWVALLDQADHEVHALEKAIQTLLPKAQMWPMGGCVAPGEAYRVQRNDEGRDFEVPRYNTIRAPGAGYVIEHAQDHPWPFGFGAPYLVIRIETGRFAEMAARRGVSSEWYVGHCNEVLLAAGERFSAGQPLARANNSMNAGWGWCEFGHWPPAAMSEGASWEPALFAPVWR